MIFEDASHRRWHITRRIGLFLLVCSVAVTAVYVYSLNRTFALPATADELNASPAYPWMSSYKKSDTAVPPAHVKATPATQLRAAAVAPSPFSIKTLQTHPGYLAVGFIVQTDRASLASFAAHADAVDIVIPDWYALPESGASDCAIVTTIDENVRDALHQKRSAIMPRLTNSGSDRWLVDELRALLRSPSKRACLVNSAADAVRQTDSKGLNIDFEGLTANDRPYLTEFMLEMADRLHRQQQLMTVDIPVDASAFDLNVLAVVSDATILMAYDQHYPGGGPGPIAAHDWVTESVERALAIIPPEKLILGIANYGYDWTVDPAGTPAQNVGYKQLVQLAGAMSAKPAMEQASKNMRFGYKDAQGQKHEVWFLDQNTFWNQQRLVQQHGLLGASLWRPGLEDPALWSLFGQAVTGTAPESALIEPVDARQADHESEVYSVIADARTGELQRRSDESGDIVEANYLNTPVGYVTERVGQPIDEQQLVLSLSGPLDPVWTPKILDTLTQSSVPALFFLTRAQAQAEPELVKEISRRGFLIGSAATTADIRTELNRLQQEVVLRTKKKTTIFQAPAREAYSALDQRAGRTLGTVSKLGYFAVDSGTAVGYVAGISEEDQRKRLSELLKNRDSSIIALRDMPPEHAAAVLPDLIAQARADGLTFASLDEAIRIPHERLQPWASGGERARSVILAIAGQLKGKHWVVIAWIFLFTNILSVTRILFLAVLALRTKHPKQRPSLATQQAPVTVVIPAYNEARTIKRTVVSVQRSTHANFVVMVVNDGSTDKTAKIVERMCQDDPRIRLISKPNGGKFSALNLAFQQATTDIIITIDADTILYPQTLDALITPFEDPNVDAVCGNVEVGNVCNLLTGFQALEYITSQNFDRRAFEALNCIGVVPGATGAWRRQRVLEIGGYESDTLVEDADVTLRLLKHGGKIVYAPEARSRTEAPASLRDLSTQRLRWSFGTFQCLRKHAGSFFHGTLGWIALPNIFFFQILYPILSPIGDIVFLWAVLTRQAASLIIGYLLFILIDFVGSVLAFRLEKRSPKKLLLLIFIQRFFYRQFMYIVAFRSIIAILRGTRQGWNKLARKGSVHATFRKKPAV